MGSAAQQALQRQLKELTTHPVPGFRVGLKDDNIFEWEVGIIGPPQTIYEGGYFKATMTFPKDFPFNPPSFTFDNDFYHPNVYTDHRLCISILHPPGDDPLSGEKAEERWNPTQSVESVLLSIVSLLSDPNCSSPANVDAGVMYRKDRKQYKEIVRKQVEASKKDIPADLTMPTKAEDFVVKHVKEDVVDDDFWYDEDADDMSFDQGSDEEGDFEDEEEEGEEDDE